jgi:hypothetical protein
MLENPHVDGDAPCFKVAHHRAEVVAKQQVEPNWRPLTIRGRASC